MRGTVTLVDRVTDLIYLLTYVRGKKLGGGETIDEQGRIGRPLSERFKVAGNI